MLVTVFYSSILAAILFTVFTYKSIKQIFMEKNMELPLGVTQENFEKCKNILYKLTGNQEVTELAINLLSIVYDKGGDYSEKTLRAFAEAYLKFK